MKSVIAAFAIAMAVPMAASAATTTVAEGTVVQGGYYGDSFKLLAGDTVQFDYTVTGPTTISFSNISTSGSGRTQTQLQQVVFWDIINGSAGPQTHFSSYLNNGGSASAVGSLPSFTTSNNFSILFSNPTSNFVTVGYTFSAVPVPAAGLMLMSALGAGGLVARKRRKTA